MAHHCHATGCTVPVPPAMFVCRNHWLRLPKPMRDRIWRAYRPGQTKDWQITHEYAEAAREAVRYLARQDGVTPDTSVYDALDPGPDA
jgi:hypothetical protein